jgi:hypothetical protein
MFERKSVKGMSNPVLPSSATITVFLEATGQTSGKDHIIDITRLIYLFDAMMTRAQ